MFWILWITHSIIVTVLLGYLHQGGLVPTLLKLNDELRLGPESTLLKNVVATDGIDFVFWKTFMPPRHLLLPLGGM